MNKLFISSSTQKESLKMKIFAAALFLTAIFGYAHSLPLGEEDADLAEKVREVIEKILSYVPETIALKNVEIEIPSNIIINGEFDITEISLSGLKNLNIDTLTYDPEARRLDYVFNFEDMVTVVETYLKLSGLVELDHPLSINVDLKDWKTEGYAVLAEDRASLEDFKVLVSLGESHFDIKGLVNNDELSKDVSKYLTENVAKIIDEVGPTLSPIVSEILKIAINAIIKIVN